MRRIKRINLVLAMIIMMVLIPTTSKAEETKTNGSGTSGHESVGHLDYAPSKDRQAMLMYIVEKKSGSDEVDHIVEFNGGKKAILCTYGNNANELDSLGYSSKVYEKDRKGQIKNKVKYVTPRFMWELDANEDITMSKLDLKEGVDIPKIFTTSSGTIISNVTTLKDTLKSELESGGDWKTVHKVIANYFDGKAIENAWKDEESTLHQFITNKRQYLVIELVTWFKLRDGNGGDQGFVLGTSTGWLRARKDAGYESSGFLENKIHSDFCGVLTFKKEQLGLKPCEKGDFYYWSSNAKDYATGMMTIWSQEDRKGGPPEQTTRDENKQPDKEHAPNDEDDGKDNNGKGKYEIVKQYVTKTTDANGHVEYSNKGQHKMKTTAEDIYIEDEGEYYDSTEGITSGAKKNYGKSGYTVKEYFLAKGDATCEFNSKRMWKRTNAKQSTSIKKNIDFSGGKVKKSFYKKYTRLCILLVKEETLENTPVDTETNETNETNGTYYLNESNLGKLINISTDENGVGVNVLEGEEYKVQLEPVVFDSNDAEGVKFNPAWTCAGHTETVDGEEVTTYCTLSKQANWLKQSWVCDKNAEGNYVAKNPRPWSGNEVGLNIGIDSLEGDAVELTDAMWGFSGFTGSKKILNNTDIKGILQGVTINPANGAVTGVDTGDGVQRTIEELALSNSKLKVKTDGLGTWYIPIVRATQNIKAYATADSTLNSILSSKFADDDADEEGSAERVSHFNLATRIASSLNKHPNSAGKSGLAGTILLCPLRLQTNEDKGDCSRVMLNVNTVGNGLKEHNGNKVIESVHIPKTNEALETEAISNCSTESDTVKWQGECAGEEYKSLDTKVRMYMGGIYNAGAVAGSISEVDVKAQRRVINCRRTTDATINLPEQGLNITSPVWCKDKAATSVHGNSVLPGGGIHKISEGDEGIQIRVVSAYLQGDAEGEANHSKAIADIKDLFSEDNAEIKYYQNSYNSDTDKAENGINITKGGTLAGSGAGASTASNKPKYYNFEDKEVKFKTTKDDKDDRTYAIQTDVYGNVWINNSIILTRTQKTLGESVTADEGIRELNRLTGIVDEVATKVERNTGNDTYVDSIVANKYPNDYTKVTEGHWYNEGMVDSVTYVVKETIIVIKPKLKGINNTLDPKLTPSNEGKEDMFSKFAVGKYIIKIKDTKQLPGKTDYYGTEFLNFYIPRGFVFKTKQIYIPNVNVQDKLLK